MATGEGERCRQDVLVVGNALHRLAPAAGATTRRAGELEGSTAASWCRRCPEAWMPDRGGAPDIHAGEDGPQRQPGESTSSATSHRYRWVVKG
jgi:hypothetical protein